MIRLNAHAIRPRFVAIAALLAVALLTVAACSDSDGSDDGGDGGRAVVSGVGPGLSVVDALASTLDGPLLVNGFILVDDDGLVQLCAGLLESFPPQCGTPSIEVRGLDLDGVEGLSSATPAAGGIRTVSWTDEPVQLLGAVSDGVLTLASNSSASGASSN